MSTASQGRRREHQVRDDMAGRGWHLIARSAGSKGPADLVMAHEEYGVALVQVGTSSKTLGPADRLRLIRAAGLCSALPIVAVVDRGINYRHVSVGPALTWEPWTP